MDANKTPLTPHRNNLPQTPNKHKKNRDDKLLLAVQEQLSNNRPSCDLLSIIMADPQLKQLNSSLQKQAQEHKKSKLLQSFPVRYNTLVQTEALYRQLQMQVKQQKRMESEMIQKYSNEITALRQSILQFENRLQSKDQQISNTTNRHKQQLQAVQQLRRKDINNKDQQLVMKDNQYYELQKKYTKLKADKDHTTQYMGQLKEQCEVLRAENDRIVAHLTHKELQIQQLQQTITSKQQQHETQIQQLMDQIGQIENQFAIRFNQKNQEYAELQHALHKATAALNNLQGQLCRAQQCHSVQQAQTQQLLKQKQGEIEGILQQKEREMKMTNSEIAALRNSIRQLQQDMAVLETAHKQQINQLESDKHHLTISMEQLMNRHEVKLLQLHTTIQQMQAQCHRRQTQCDIKIVRMQQDKAILQHSIAQLQQQHQSTAKQLSVKTAQHQQLLAQLQQAHNQIHKQQANHSSIEQMVAEFKKQLSNYTDIVNQKEDKIQSYRKEILALRRQAKQMAISTQQMLADAQQTEHHITQLVKEKQQMEIRCRQLQIQQNELMNSMRNKQMTSIAIQSESIDDDGIHQIQGEIQSLTKQLERAQLKYQNVIEQLNQYRRQFEEQLIQRDNLIAQLQHQNMAMRPSPPPTNHSNQQLQQAIDLKISELKQFYERKLEQEGSKYRKIIDTLKSQMTQLYNDIDLKKSIEDEMFGQIMRINAQRRSKTDAH